MSSATDALALVKDAKKFEAQLAKLAKAEKSAVSAIDAANAKAASILAKARDELAKAEATFAEADKRLKAAQAAEDGNTATVLAAQEATQKANQHEKRIGKAKDALVQDRGILDRDREEHSNKVEALHQRAEAFETAAKNVVKAAIG